MEPFATGFEWTELLTRIHNDTKPPEVADTVYCFGQTTNNTTSVVEMAAELLRAGSVRTVSIPTYGELVAYNWYHDFIRQMLMQHGIPEECIIPIPHPQEFDTAHTHSEAVGFIHYALEKHWCHVYITALPSHQNRAFVDAVSALRKERPRYNPLYLYSNPGVVLPWIADADHAQDGVKGKRYEVFGSENEKILRDFRKGDLISARHILDYLNLRDDYWINTLSDEELNQQGEQIARFAFNDLWMESLEDIRFTHSGRRAYGRRGDGQIVWTYLAGIEPDTVPKQ